MTMYRVGPAGIPASLKTNMDAVLNKKFGTSTTYAPATWPDNVNLLGPLPEKTASGSVASITDGADRVPVKSWTINVDPNLTGKSQIIATQTGKNLFDKENPNVVDGYIDTVSFNTGNQNAKTIYIPIKGGETYTVSKTAGVRFVLATSENIPSSGALYTSRKANNTASSLYITADVNDKYLWAWVFLDGTDTETLDDMLASVQIEVGNTATAYEPYAAPTVSTVNLGRTIYGGSVDVAAGTGTDTHILYTAADVTGLYWNNRKAQQVDTYHRATFRIAIPSGYIVQPNSLCNDLTYSANITGGTGSMKGYQIVPTAGIYFCIDLADIGMASATSDTPNQDFIDAIHEYGDNLKFSIELSTPEDFTFTPITPTPETALGASNFWADEGDSEVTYRADINMLISSLSGNRGLMMSRPQLEAITEENKEDPEVTEK